MWYYAVHVYHRVSATWIFNVESKRELEIGYVGSMDNDQLSE